MKEIKGRSLKNSMRKTIMHPFTMLFKLTINLSLQNYWTITSAVRINLYQCFSLIGSVFFFIFQDVNLLGYNAQTPLHLAASSSEIEMEIDPIIETEGAIFQV